nr:MAG TPA: hypothetical protein [Caudoviricetes sp.]
MSSCEFKKSHFLPQVKNWTCPKGAKFFLDFQ